jgi:hypothetical protein
LIIVAHLEHENNNFLNRNHYHLFLTAENPLKIPLQ